MSTAMEDEIKRWTAKRKSALVLEVLQSKTTVAEASRAYDLPIRLKLCKGAAVVTINVAQVLGSRLWRRSTCAPRPGSTNLRRGALTSRLPLCQSAWYPGYRFNLQAGLAAGARPGGACRRP